MKVQYVQLTTQEHLKTANMMYYPWRADTPVSRALVRQPNRKLFVIGKKSKRTYSTKKQDLPENPIKAEIIKKRRERNKMYDSKRRARQKEKAEKGDRNVQVREYIARKVDSGV